jgi:serine/threonine-protein kinase ULK/ATG1
MAPELIKEEAVADPKVDMWSLGIVLYRMLFGGQFPFLNPNKKYGNREQAFNDILQSPLNIPKHPRRSHDLVELVSRMLEKDPNVRISWEELFLHPLININESKP